MKATANRAALADAAKWVAGAIANRPTQPALAGMRVQACGEGTLVLTAHDFDTVHSADVDAAVDETGTAMPVGFMFRDLLGALKGDRVDLAVDGAQLGLKAGRASYAVSLFDERDWFPFPVHDMRVVGTVDAGALRNAVNLASSAVDNNDALPLLRALRLEADPGGLRVVGTNRLRLAVGYSPGWVGDTFTSQPVAGALVDALRGMDGPVTVSASDGALGLDCGGRAVVLRVVDGQYPEWSRLFKDPAFVVEVDGGTLRDACKRAALAVDKAAGAVVLTVAGDELRVAGSSDSASGDEVVDVTGGGGDYVTSWTPASLTAALGGLPTGPVRLGFGGTSANPPLRINDAAGTFDYLVMPRRRDA